MDLFKAIFENSEPSSSSSSSSEASDAEDKQEMKIDSQTMNNLKPAGDDTRPATAPDVTSAAVSDAAPLTLQLPAQQQAGGMIVLVK